MAQLVGEGHHVVHPVLVALEDHGVGVRRVVRAERPAPLALARLGVDPVPVEELLRPRGHLLAERAEGAEDDPLRLLPRDLLLGVEEGGVAVDVGEFGEAQDAPLHVVEAGDHRVVLHAHRDDEVDRGLLQLVREVAALLGVVHAPQAVVGGLVEEEGVVDEDEGPLDLLQADGKGVGGPLALRAVGVAQESEDLLLGGVPAVELEHVVRGQLLEEPVPGAGAGVGGLLEDDLLRLAQAERAERAGGADVVGVGLDGVGVDARGLLELKLEEHQLDAQGRVPLALGLVERADLGGGGVGGVEEAGVADGLGDDHVDRLQVGDGPFQGVGGKRIDLAPVPCLERIDRRFGLLPGGLDLGVLGAGEEGGEVPTDLGGLERPGFVDH